MEFVSWFSLHDRGDCSEAARIHFKVTPQQQMDEDYNKIFKEFMFSLGLENLDGSPKEAWYTWW